MEDIGIELKILDYLQDRLSDTERREVDDLLNSSPSFATKFSEVKQVWEGLDLRTVPEMDPSVKNDFQAMLKTFELEQVHKIESIWNSVTDLFRYKQQYNWVYAILLVGFGAMISYVFLKTQNNSDAKLSQNPNDVRQTQMLSMLENPTAAERMKAVGYTDELNSVNDKVINALLVTLNTDANENVRLATLDALTQLADNPKVRKGLVNSIVRQESELMQVALADAMLHLQEKRSLKSFKKLLNGESVTNDMIRKKLEQTVRQLETI
ncbi:hypothetical protein [Mucilaginibacter sp. HD30]